MKTAIYIENGLVQLVITPENDFEEAAIRSFEEQSAVAAEIFHGSFYDCRGSPHTITQTSAAGMMRMTGA